MGFRYLLSTPKESDIILDSRTTQMKISHNFEAITVALLYSLGLKMTDKTAENRASLRKGQLLWIMLGDD